VNERRVTQEHKLCGSSDDEFQDRAVILCNVTFCPYPEFKDNRLIWWNNFQGSQQLGCGVIVAFNQVYSENYEQKEKQKNLKNL
jgi:hypothetical protein